PTASRNQGALRAGVCQRGLHIFVYQGSDPAVALLGCHWRQHLDHRARPMAAEACALLYPSISRTVAQSLGRILSGKAVTNIATFVPPLARLCDLWLDSVEGGGRRRR